MFDFACSRTFRRAEAFIEDGILLPLLPQEQQAEDDWAKVMEAYNSMKEFCGPAAEHKPAPIEHKPVPIQPQQIRGELNYLRAKLQEHITEKRKSRGEY